MPSEHEELDFDHMLAEQHLELFSNEVGLAVPIVKRCSLWLSTPAVQRTCCNC